VRLFLKGMRRGGSTVPKMDGIAKSGAVAREAEDGG
jgi:hypothetical protein